VSAFQLSEAALERRRARDRRDGLVFSTHLAGRCGMDVGACCSACYADTWAELVSWALLQADPEPGESASAYWSRIGGRFLDPWHDAAVRRGALP